MSYDQAVLRSQQAGGAFTVATLPTALQMISEPQGIMAYTSDQGMMLWNGVAWIPSGGPAVGPALSLSPSSGTIDPSIPGFLAGIGSAGTGRIKVTLSADTSFEGLPLGVDGQNLLVTVVSGAFLLVLLANNASTAQAQIFAKTDSAYGLGDTSHLIFDGGMGQWVLLA